MCENSNAISNCFLRFIFDHTFYIDVDLDFYLLCQYKIGILFNKKSLEKPDMFSVFRGIAEH